MEPPYPPPVPFEKIAELQTIVESRFVVKEMYIDRGIPVFLVSLQPTEEQPEALKGVFKEVALKIKGRGFFPFLRRENGQLVLRIVQKTTPSSPSRPWIKIALFLATCVTVFLNGYLSADNPVWTMELMPQVPAVLQAIFFTISILAVIGLHELGHKIACVINHVDASMPYFIPAPPVISPGGTFGAVITLKEPPTNRDELFDLGLNGPLIGFCVTIIVAFIGVLLSPVVSFRDILRWENLYGVEFSGLGLGPLLMDIASVILGKIPPCGYTLLLHPIGFAAWVGAVVTFLNLMPIAVLDGGHISMALFGPKGHRITSIMGIVLLLITGFWPMALLVLFFMFGRPYGVPLLDGVSPLTNSRKLAALFVPVMISLC
ncbi:MAG: site-2 protease family protein, partial [Candidatus Bathyarchaeia archaeon]